MRVVKIFVIGISGLLLLGASAQSGSKPAVKPLDFAPIAYFDRACARCHGKNGSNYGDEFGKNLSDVQLKEKIKQMAEGPGQSPLNNIQLEVQTAYHRAMIAQEPFIAVTKLTKTTLSGEVTSGATVSVAFGKSNVKANLKRSEWTITTPKGASASQAIITTKLNGKTISLNLSKSAYSHSQPKQ